LAAFQQSQIDESPQHHAALSMMTPTSKNRLGLPEDEHTTTASALAAAQVLYNTTPSVGTPYANQYPQHMYQQSQSSRRQHAQLLPEEIPSQDEAPAMIATKIHHPRGGNVYPSTPTINRAPSGAESLTPSVDQPAVSEGNVYDIAMI
jgi:hypothetical protein